MRVILSVWSSIKASLKEGTQEASLPSPLPPNSDLTNFLSSMSVRYLFLVENSHRGSLIVHLYAAAARICSTLHVFTLYTVRMHKWVWIIRVIDSYSDDSGTDGKLSMTGTQIQ